MKADRSWPVLLMGFGLLVALVALSGFGALTRARETYQRVSAINDRYGAEVRLLNEVLSDIQTGGLVARDYLLDPSRASAPAYRAALAERRSRMEAALAQLTAGSRPADATRLARLREEVDAYWDEIGPLFEWTPQEKARRSWDFLHRELLPRRDAALQLAGEIRELAGDNLARERTEVDLLQARLSLFIGRMLAVTVLLGLLIAGVTVSRIHKLERHFEAQRLRAEAAEEQMRRLSRQVVQAQEDERRSLSRELHDEVGQSLTALRLELGTLRNLREASEPEFLEHLDDAKALAEQSLRSVRGMAMGLRPTMLDDLGLGPAIQWQAREFSKHTGVPVDVRIEGNLAHLPDRHKTCVYRIVQEALTNCARHAHAKTIAVAVEGKEDLLEVRIQDDGVGFNQATARPRGLGLIGIEERVRELGGRFQLHTKHTGGTTLQAAIPIPVAAEAQ